MMCPCAQVQRAVVAVTVAFAGDAAAVLWLDGGPCPPLPADASRLIRLWLLSLAPPHRCELGPAS